MKTWLILLALYTGSAPDHKPDGLLMMPGAFTKAECFAVKKMLDRDHLAGIGPDTDHMAKMHGQVSCINGQAINTKD